MFNFIKYSKIYFAIGGIFILGALYFLIAFGLNLGMDFEGGTSIKVEYEGERPAMDDIKSNLTIENYDLQTFGTDGLIIKLNEQDLTAEESMSIIESLGEGVVDYQFETISPVVGSELKSKTIVVSIVALIAMLLYIAFAFRKVSRPISSFQYGFVSTLMLFHDILIPLGVIAILGVYSGMQLTIPIVTALLAVIGYSINNSVVVFDRIRENLILEPNKDYGEIVNKSLNQIVTRCIQTSLTTLFVLAALYYFFQGEQSIQYFALTAGVGILAGTFSSIFLASPILVAWTKIRK
jgi:preprotein translocase subunit SecF